MNKELLRKTRERLYTGLVFAATLYLISGFMILVSIMYLSTLK